MAVPFFVLSLIIAEVYQVHTDMSVFTKFIVLLALVLPFFTLGQTLTFEELVAFDVASLEKKFASEGHLEIKVDLTLSSIGSDKKEFIETVMATKIANGFQLEIPHGPYYLSVPNKLVEGSLVCKSGMISSGAKVFQTENNRTIQFDHGCGTAGCGYTIRYEFSTSESVCDSLID